MSEEEIEDLKRRAERLRREIERHNRLYYDEAAPEIPDQEFDVLFRALRDLEEKHPELATEDPPTQRVGGRPSQGFSQVRHALSMRAYTNTRVLGGRSTRIKSELRF
jgi:DNA ligase (NAD+)